MSEVKKLFEKRARLLEEQKDIAAEARKSEKGTMTKEQLEKYDKIEEDYVELTATIDKMVEIEKKESEDSFKIEKQAKEEIADKGGFKDSESFNKSYNQAFVNYIQKGVMGLDSKERDLLNSRYQKGTNTLITGTDSLGGYAVPEGFSNEIEKYMNEISDLRKFARVYRTNTGNPLDWPTVDDTGNSGALTTEGSANDVLDTTFGNNTLNSYTISSKIVKISLELLQDTGIPMEQIIGEILGDRIGRALNPYLTTGTGSSQPHGVVTGAGEASNVASGSSTVAVADFINLKHSVDRNYRMSSMAAFMMNDDMLRRAKLLTITSSDDRPLWQASIQVGEPSTIDGSPYIINQDMADFGTATNKYLIFGDFSKFIIRDVGAISMFRFEEKYMDALSKGFTAWLRTDSRVINTNAFKYVYYPAT